jgi:hypothetical protein
MEQILYNAINDAFPKVELVRNKARRDCPIKILVGIIKSKQVQFHAIADEIQSKAKKKFYRKKNTKIF